MLRRNIVIDDYKIRVGSNDDEYGTITNRIRSIIEHNIQEISSDTTARLYNLGGEYHTHKVGTPKRKLIIFNNGSKIPTSRITKGNHIIIIDDWVLEKKYNKLSENTDCISIKDSNETIIAQWDKGNWQLNILLDLFTNVNEDDFTIFTYIMKQLNNILMEEGFDNSWKRTSDKSVITNTIRESISSTIERDKERLKRDIEDYRNSLDEYKSRIKVMSDALMLKMKHLESIDDVIDAKINNIMKDLDLIINNESIYDIKFENGIFTIYTNHLNITSDKDDKYNGGKFKIQLNMNTSDVRFFSDNPRKGYWTENDPHPHVDGNRGNPCLGNVSSTIAELCSQGELYALALICVDFLQSANTEDVAGKNVRNWDRIDKNGNIIPAEKYRSDTMYTCDRCGHEGDYEEEETYVVYSYYDQANEEYGDEQVVCVECRNDHYEWYEDINEAVGEIINPISYIQCDSCGNDVNNEELNLVYENYDVLNDQLGDEQMVCSECFVNYTWDEVEDAYIGEYINVEPDEEDNEGDEE